MKHDPVLYIFTSPTGRRLPLVLLALAVALGSTATLWAQVAFKKIVLDEKFRSEGCAVGDFNHDGKLDVSAGTVYYAAPDWRMVALVEKPETYDPKSYSRSFGNFADDINGDGRTDLIVTDHPGMATWWLEQPEKEGQPWTRHDIMAVANNESPGMYDIDGDGQEEWLMAFDPAGYIGYAKRKADRSALWDLIAISAAGAPGSERYSHGIGAGDINSDGRLDVLVTAGWWEQPPAGKPTPWTFHPAPFGEPCAEMCVGDFDGDGDADVLSSSAHKVGVWWHEQKKEGWQTHEIADNFSQSHSMCMADLNGDKLPDFVTGKRWWAHGPNGDIDPEKPAVVYWFELVRKNGTAEWIAHQIDDDSGVGTQFQVADVNGDARLDIVTVNKKGARIFEQQKP